MRFYCRHCKAETEHEIARTGFAYSKLDGMLDAIDHDALCAVCHNTASIRRPAPATANIADANLDKVLADIDLTHAWV